MSPKITINADESPEIGIAEPGTSWDEVEDYVRLTHRHVLALPPGGAMFRGIYFDQQALTVRATGDLTSDLREALVQFRELLHAPASSGDPTSV